MQDESATTATVDPDGAAPPDETDERTSEMNQKYIDAAREIHGSEGEIEIDADAEVSYSSDGGAYVAAWVWVPCDAVGLTEEENEEFV